MGSLNSWKINNISISILTRVVMNIARCALVGPSYIGPIVHGVWLLAHCGPRWCNVHGRFSRELFRALELLLFRYTLEYLGSALGNVVIEHYPASSSSSNIQVPVPKVRSNPVRNN